MSMHGSFSSMLCIYTIMYLTQASPSWRALAQLEIPSRAGTAWHGSARVYTYHRKRASMGWPAYKCLCKWGIRKLQLLSTVGELCCPVSRLYYGIVRRLSSIGASKPLAKIYSGGGNMWSDGRCLLSDGWAQPPWAEPCNKEIDKETNRQTLAHLCIYTRCFGSFTLAVKAII